MIEEGKGSIFNSGAEVLVNPVNTVGVMGGGLALAFKRTFPDCYKQYRISCNVGECVTGKMHIYKNIKSSSPKYIFNFPTKEHYANPSELSYVKYGMVDLVNQVKELDIKSIAIPSLGCGLGGLEWDDVKVIIEEECKNIPDVKVIVFSPQ